jgi:hypothetical protein
MKKIILMGAAAAAVLGACSADKTDFKDQAAKFIEGDTVAEQAGQKFTDAECVEPASTDTGETFTCSATGDDGVVWDFDLEITGDNEFTVTGGTPQG